MSSRRGFLGGLIGGAAALVVARKTEPVTVELDGSKIIQNLPTPKFIPYGRDMVHVTFPDGTQSPFRKVCGCGLRHFEQVTEMDGVGHCNDCHGIVFPVSLRL